MKGNEAIAMGAIEAGCRFYFGYPIAPKNEIPEYRPDIFPKWRDIYPALDLRYHKMISMNTKALERGARFVREM